MPGGKAVISKIDGVSIDITGSPGAAGTRTDGGPGGVCTTGAGCRVAVVHALTYSVAKNKSQKEERCIAVKNIN